MTVRNDVALPAGAGQAHLDAALLQVLHGQFSLTDDQLNPGQVAMGQCSAPENPCVKQTRIRREISDLGVC